MARFDPQRSAYFPFADEDVRNFYIIFQPGKVASKSIEKSINGFDGCRAFQAHFLGEKSLTSMVSEVLSPKQNPHLKIHKEGQLVKNMRTQYLVNLFRAGQAPATCRLRFIVVLRDSLSFARSAFTQQFPAWQGFIERLQGKPVSAETITAFVEDLTVVMEEFFASQTDTGYLSFRRWLEAREAARPAQQRNALQEVYSLFFRNEGWKRQQLFHNFSIPQDGFQPVGSGSETYLKADVGWSEFAVFDFSNITPSLKAYLGTELGDKFDADGFELARENLTEDKPFSTEIAEAFVAARTTERLGPLTASPLSAF